MMRKTWGKSVPPASTANDLSGCRRAEEKDRKKAGEGMAPTTGASNPRQSSATSSTLIKTLSAETTEE